MEALDQVSNYRLINSGPRAGKGLTGVPSRPECMGSILPKNRASINPGQFTRSFRNRCPNSLSATEYHQIPSFSAGVAAMDRPLSRGRAGTDGHINRGMEPGVSGSARPVATDSPGERLVKAVFRLDYYMNYYTTRARPRGPWPRRTSAHGFVLGS